jgi:hypothetical protein
MPKFPKKPLSSSPDPLVELYAKLDTASVKASMFRAHNREVFDEEERLREDVESVVAQIRALLAKKYAGKPSGFHTPYTGTFATVTVMTKMARTIDVQLLQERLPTDQMAYFGMKCLSQKVDMAALDALIEDGVIDKAIVESCTARKPMTPAISVGRNKVQEEKT